MHHGSSGSGGSVSWGYNSLGYNWWDYAQEKNVDAKVGRIAYSLAGLLVKDRLPRGKDSLSKLKIKFFDFGSDGDLASLLESIGTKVELVKGPEITMALLHGKLDIDQLVIINGMYHGQPKEAFQNITNYVSEGGRLLIFNSAPHLVSMIFPGKIQPAPHSICVSAKLKIGGSDKEIFSGFGDSEEVTLEYGRYPVGVFDTKNVKVLAKINAQTPEPLLLKWSQGSGATYLWISRMFLKEKDINLEQATKYLTDRGASKDTIMAWQCAFDVGFKNGISYAVATFPGMELIAKVILKEYTAIEEIAHSSFAKSDIHHNVQESSMHPEYEGQQ